MWQLRLNGNTLYCSGERPNHSSSKFLRGSDERLVPSTSRFSSVR